MYKLQLLEFEGSRTNCSDNGLLYRTMIKQPRILLATPTNDKKWKKCIVNVHNEGEGAIPLYLTARVDDIVVLSPDYYYIQIDEDDNYVYYQKTENPNGDITLKSSVEVISGSILGEMILGDTTLGDVRHQTFKIDINGKGKGLSIELADNYYDDEGELVGTNTKPFSISDIGFIYKLKKPKAR